MQAVVALGFLNEDEALEALGGQLGLPVRPALAPEDVDAELVERVPIALREGARACCRSA